MSGSIWIFSVNSLSLTMNVWRSGEFRLLSRWESGIEVERSCSPDEVCTKVIFEAMSKAQRIMDLILVSSCVGITMVATFSKYSESSWTAVDRVYSSIPRCPPSSCS